MSDGLRIILPVLIAALVMAVGSSSARGERIGLRNESCAIEFDGTTGALISLENVPLKDNVLKALTPAGCPFRIYADFEGEWLLNSDPEEAAKVHLGPEDLSLKDAKNASALGEQRLSLKYAGAGLQCTLKVSLINSTGDSRWTLSVKNTGKAPRTVLIEFPRIDGVQMGRRTSTNRQTVMRQAGYTEEAWKDKGDVYGLWNMQWHSVYDPASHSALGLMVEDPKILNKRFVFSKPTVSVRYFPPMVLKAGESVTLPSARIMIYEGDWRPAARAYAEWYRKNIKPVKQPEWFAESDGILGWHLKKGVPGTKPDYGYQFVLDSFRDLPAAHMQVPADFMEYAFWTRGTMLYGVHTDGDNIFREDLGGPEAMRDAVAALHKLGLRTGLYIEGYIVYKESDLAKQGEAENWSVMHRDGSITGGYTDQGFYHMCPGCVEWQDYLAATVARVLRETGADGVRLDSLGFYFLPCYNPAHHHESPFDYNKWTAQLLAKVRQAALEVNPNAALTTEAPVDFWGRWFHGALVQNYPREISPMRIAVPDYRPTAYSAAGSVWSSISGFSGTGNCEPSNTASFDFNWICAQTTAHDALVWGDAADDPTSGDPDIVARHFVGKDCHVVVALRPASKEEMWPASAGLSQERKPYQVSYPFTGKPPREIALCDVETLKWTRFMTCVNGGRMILPGESNWMLAVIPRGGVQVVGFDPLPSVSPGGEVVIRPARIAGEGKTRTVEVWAPGLLVGPEGKSSAEVEVGSSVTVRVPPDAVPGWYQIRIQGRDVLGIRRLLHVVKISR